MVKEISVLQHIPSLHFKLQKHMNEQILREGLFITLWDLVTHWRICFKISNHSSTTDPSSPLALTNLMTVLLFLLANEGTCENMDMVRYKITISSAKYSLHIKLVSCFSYHASSAFSSTRYVVQGQILSSKHNRSSWYI